MAWTYSTNILTFASTGNSLADCGGDGIPTSGGSYVSELDTVHHLWVVYNFIVTASGTGNGHVWEDKDQIICHIKGGAMAQFIDFAEDAANKVLWGSATLTNPQKPIVYGGNHYFIDQNGNIAGYGWAAGSGVFEQGSADIYGGTMGCWPVQSSSSSGTLWYWPEGTVQLIGVNFPLYGGIRFQHGSGRLQELKFGGSRRKGTSMPEVTDVISVKDVIFQDNIYQYSFSDYAASDIRYLNCSTRQASTDTVRFDNSWDADGFLDNCDDYPVNDWSGDIDVDASLTERTSYEFTGIDESGDPIDDLNVRVTRTLASTEGSEPPSYNSSFLQVAIGDTTMVAGTTISASTTDDSFNDSGSGFDDTLVAGEKIIVSGFTESANNGTFTVVSATTAKIIVSENLVTESAGDTVSVSAGKRPFLWLIRRTFSDGASEERTHYSGFFTTIRKYGYNYEHIAKYPVYGAGKGLVDVIIMKANPFTDGTLAAVSAYTGISMSTATSTITVSSAHTLQEVYDWLQWECAKQANMDFESGGNGVEVSPLGTADGNVFTVATGWTLSGEGFIDLDGKIFEKASGDRIVEINLTNMEPGSYYTIHKDGDPATTYLYEGYIDDNGDFSTRYTWTQTNVDVEVKVRLQGYYQYKQAAQITGGGLNVAVNSQADPYYRVSEGAFTQTHYRWRYDDGDQDDASWRAAVDVDVTGITLSESIRLRVQFEENTSARGANIKPKLQYRLASSSGLWEDVGDKP